MKESMDAKTVFDMLSEGGEAVMSLMEQGAEQRALNSADLFPFTLDKPSGMVGHAEPYVLASMDSGMDINVMAY